MQLVSLYPFDPTGRATANRIENQSITVTPPTQITDYSYVVPRGAPFYADSLVVKDGRNVGARTLVENVDYWCVIDFLSASVSLTKRVCVGIALLDPGYSGTLYVTYQAVGGNYSLADYSVLEELIRERYVVKHVSYEQIVNMPEGFAPEWHRHEIADMVGMGQVVAMLSNIKVAIEGRQGSYGQLSAQVSNHTGSAAAHTPSQVGLSNVKNYDVATIAEANSGAANKYITASVLKQYVSGQGQDVSAFITATTANATFATKAQLNSYFTSAQTDAKYALKSDTYTKTQVNALVEGIDVSSALGGYYTKTQTDAKYALKTDISGYIKETVADGRYATKASMTSYLTTTQSDSKYAPKTASYTKVESDGRYLVDSDLYNYMTESTANARYQLKTSMSSYYTKSESDRENISLSFVSNPSSNYDSDYALQYTQRHANNVTSTSETPISLPKHVLKSEVYTKSQVDNLVNSAQPVYVKKFTSTISYRSYAALSTSWVLKYVQSTGMVHVTAYITSPFYYSEDDVLKLVSGPAPANGTGGNISYDSLSFSAEILTSNQAIDAWVRPATRDVTLLTNGQIEKSVYFNHETSGNSYVNGFQVLMSFNVDSRSDHNRIMQWFTSANLINTNW